MNALEQWLLEQSRCGRDLYLMLDADEQPDEHKALANDLGAAHYRNLYAGTVASTMTGSGPFLYRIANVRHPVIQALLNVQGQQWGWLASASNFDLDALATHWRKRVVVGERPYLALYRFHDNRVVARALSFMPPEQHPEYLGPLSSLCYWDATQWTITDNPCPGEYPVPPEPAWLKIPTPDDVYAKVQFDNARRFLVREYTEALARVATERDVDDWLWRQLDRARAWGWQRPEQVHFILIHCLQTPDFEPLGYWTPKPDEQPDAHFERVYHDTVFRPRNAPL